MRLILLSLLCFLTHAQQSNTLFDQQWYLNNQGQGYQYQNKEYHFPQSFGVPGIDINWLPASEIKPSSPDKQIIVAVIDTGIDFEHPDLQGRIWIDKKKCPNPEKVGPQCYGHNFIDPINLYGVKDDMGHGTHVSGVIAANDNKIGIIGAAHNNIQIMPIKVLSKKVTKSIHNGRILSDYFAMGIRYAIKNKADVINISAGFPKHLLSEQFILAIQEATKANIPIVAAAGNNSKDMPVYPCHFQEVICVGAIDNKGNFARDTNFSQRVDILAPGEHIISTLPTSSVSEILRFDQYEAYEGSSQAAPLVTAVIANMKLEQDGLSIDQIKTRLFSTAKSINPDDEKFSNYGLVDMKASLSPKASPTTFFHPMIKGEDKIIFKSDDLHFQYIISVKNLSKKPERVSMALDKIKDIEFENLNLNSPIVLPNAVYNFIIKGKVKSFDIDHLMPLQITLNSGDYHHQYKLNLIMARELKENVSLSLPIESPLKTQNYNLISTYQKQAFMKPVIDIDYKHRSPSFYTTQSFRQNNNRIISMHFINNETISNKRLLLPITDRVEEIFRADFNLDGSPDYMISGIRRRPKTGVEEHYFRFCDSDLKPLYGKGSSVWTIPAYYPFVDLVKPTGKINPKTNKEIMTPIVLLKYKEQQLEFSLMKYKSFELGEILVPVIYLNGLSPQLGDIDPIDLYRPNKYKQYFAFIPEKSGSTYNINPKPLYNNLIEKKLRARDDLDIKLRETALIESPYKDKPNQFMMSVGERYKRTYYKIKFNNQLEITTIDKIQNNGLTLLNSEIVPIFPYELNEYNFVINTSRWKKRNTIFQDNELQDVNQQASVNWLDMLFYHISTSKLADDYHFYNASRYWIHFSNSNGDSSKVPIKRENSFSGEKFSELTQKAIVSTTQGLTTGIAIDSTKLYGDFAYVIHEKNNELIRPIRFTIKFEHECNYFSTQKLNNEKFSTIIFVCNQNQKPFLKMVPLRY